MGLRRVQPLWITKRRANSIDMIRAFIWYCEMHGTSLLQGRVPLPTPVWKKGYELPMEVRAAIQAGYIQPVEAEDDERTEEREVGRDFVFRWSAAEWYLVYRNAAEHPKDMQEETMSETCSIDESEIGGMTSGTEEECAEVASPEGSNRKTEKVEDHH